MTDDAAYVRIPFADKGRDRGGVDCWGGVRLFLMDECGAADLPSCSDDYEDTLDFSKIPILYESNKPDWLEIAPGHERRGDVVLIRERGWPMHVGVVLGARRMLHWTAGVGGSIEDYTGLKFRSRIIGFYRHKSLQA